MALVVEDGSEKTNANSYVSVSEADAYHADRGNAAWANASADEKEQALIKATEYLDFRYYGRWKGYKATEDQSLEWPREWVYDRSGWLLEDIPQRLKDATCEAALRALSEELSPDVSRDQMQRRVTVGPITTEYQDRAPASKQFTKVFRLLRGLVDSPGGVRITRG